MTVVTAMYIANALFVRSQSCVLLSVSCSFNAHCMIGNNKSMHSVITNTSANIE